MPGLTSKGPRERGVEAPLRQAPEEVAHGRLHCLLDALECQEYILVVGEVSGGVDLHELLVFVQRLLRGLLALAS